MEIISLLNRSRLVIEHDFSLRENRCITKFQHIQSNLQNPKIIYLASTFNKFSAFPDFTISVLKIILVMRKWFIFVKV